MAQRVGERQPCTVERDDAAEDLEQGLRALGRGAGRGSGLGQQQFTGLVRAHASPWDSAERADPGHDRTGCSTAGEDTDQVVVPRDAAVHRVRRDVEPQARESWPNASTARSLSSAVACPVDLRQLRYFLTVAEERRFSSAARRLHVAAPSLSQQIRALERDLRVTLFDRTPRGAELTACGARPGGAGAGDTGRGRPGPRGRAIRRASGREQVTLRVCTMADGSSTARCGGGHRDPGRRGRRDVQPGGRRRRGGPAGAGRCSGRLEPAAGAPGPRRHRPRFGAVRRRPAAGAPARRPDGDPGGRARPTNPW